MARKKSSNPSQENSDRIVYREFGKAENSEAIARGKQQLPPNQQNLRVQASRKGRKGKTVTVISGFQQQPESLAELLKKLKTQCGAGGAVKENTIEIQGDHTQKLLEILTNMEYKAKISGR
ncbi:MAG: translation initiation factor [Hormoscilla sp. GUM202]|nr:translation initiation factor [Hormoscilla sp. GUM202]